ncbi:MAG: pyridoxamine 5'-phosphate oxidase family protein [Patescibacteria group bacterium]
MKAFDPSIVDYLKTQRIGVLAVEMLDGSPHAATVHFAYDENSNQFFFETRSEYRKAEPITKRNATRASFVVGVNENDLKTLQLDGDARLITAEEKILFEKVYLGKFPNKKEKAADPKFISFVFEPTWWRFTDWTRPEGKVILVSD